MVERLKEMWQDARQMRDERGLTLVELLVVVVILGIIAAISVIAVGNLIENSRKDAQVANAKQLVNAAKLYVSSESVTPSASGVSLYYVGDTASTGGNVLTNYIDEMKDPMNNDAPYADAYVTVTKTGNKYGYAVTMKSTKSGASNYFTTDATPTRAELP
ncbi:prepilin-type N-terminal cleavage/methylation domain-containing protein [Exiguobacterium flavidum]|uniref:prepilin-type N-terminal cleavage/methylation domain-containing protein n=1 Tax=Exiguobacterium flavidum TaxID=2184695 RepID=UPI000DF741EE|nr:prepilin-type N-terminal cleavage/methylation domain-containing protein [Exiguobacterium flavidum]